MTWKAMIAGGLLALGSGMFSFAQAQDVDPACIERCQARMLECMDRGGGRTECMADYRNCLDACPAGVAVLGLEADAVAQARCRVSPGFAASGEVSLGFAASGETRGYAAIDKR
ncbi:hypothetical protein [Luteimonas aquatica]|uniref:hypothetical protein n=1 Tax=Luteimonas aquatica TaxID=450364 RepID=UPI001F569725|nr:hypothetical protein [Luteimonas aquatica]